MGATRLAATLAVFVTMLVLVIVRPRRWNEAWWTVLAAGAMLALRLVAPQEALSATLAGKSALLFLLALLLLSLFVGKSGFFDWAAIQSARIANGDAHVLYRNAFVLGALVTAVLSLDTTAVILTPVVIALVKRLKVPAAPYIVLCAFVANVGSLLLPISNLTNILFASVFRLSFAGFALRMLGPQLVALGVTYALLRWHFRRELPPSFDAAATPTPGSVIPNPAYFQTCVAVLVLVLVGYFVAPFFGVEAYVVAFFGAFVLFAAGLVTGRVPTKALGELSWGVFPFVVGLFVAVRGLENLGIVELCSKWLVRSNPGSTQQLFVVAGATAVAANLTNNLPAALLARSALLGSHTPVSTALAALIGADAGSIVTPFGSLATMLVLAIARQEGVPVPLARVMRLAALTALAVVVVATLALTVTLCVVP
jgi:arsenical pump membrane protein